MLLSDVTESKILLHSLDSNYNALNYLDVSKMNMFDVELDWQMKVQLIILFVEYDSVFS